jgi:hypothetical protein
MAFSMVSMVDVLSMIDEVDELETIENLSRPVLSTAEPTPSGLSVGAAVEPMPFAEPHDLIPPEPPGRTERRRWWHRLAFWRRPAVGCHMCGRRQEGACPFGHRC